MLYFMIYSRAYFSNNIAFMAIENFENNFKNYLGLILL